MRGDDNPFSTGDAIVDVRRNQGIQGDGGFNPTALDSIRKEKKIKGKQDAIVAKKFH
jgi:hypothetical protein